MTFILPYPPSTNTAYAVRNGRKIKTKKAREYAQAVLDEITYAFHVRGEPRTLHPHNRLVTKVEVFTPDKRRRDLENTTKIAIDALMKALSLDDSQIDELHLYRRSVDRSNPRLVITVEPI